MTIITDGLTNSEIFASEGRMRSDGRFLTAIQQQVSYVMRLEMARKPCPNCGELHNLPEAAGVAVDDFDFGNHGDDRIGKCRKCQRTLIFTLPLFGGWHWRLDPDEALTKEQQRAYDKQADHIDGYDRDDLGESPDY